MGNKQFQNFTTLFKIYHVFSVDKSGVAAEDVTHSEKVVQLLRKKYTKK